MKTFKQTVALLLSVFMVLLTLGAVPVMAEEKSGHTTIADGVNEVTIDGKTFAVIRDKAGLMAKITEGILSENLIFANDIDMGGECFSAAIANLQSTIDGNGFALYNGKRVSVPPLLLYLGRQHLADQGVPRREGGSIRT